ncbi:unnamed protein product [Rangifer tarandus platyrhynchus]|uniref:Uncharacterized protein n=1 Tax=Rangifer tarandus platyrhynchus TaxID=3082113 RepID=A0ABN8XIF9_RANTA|nr:unnamed protein product [Rangifer tarandus platyrhynchus]
MSASKSPAYRQPDGIALKTTCSFVAHALRSTKKRMLDFIRGRLPALFPALRAVVESSSTANSRPTVFSTGGERKSLRCRCTEESLAFRVSHRSPLVDSRACKFYRND